MRFSTFFIVLFLFLSCKEKTNSNSSTTEISDTKDSLIAKDFREFKVLDINTQQATSKNKKAIQDEINVVGYAPKVILRSQVEEVFKQVDEMPQHRVSND